MRLIGPVGIVHSVQDFSASTELYGARQSAIADIMGSIYIFVATDIENGLQILRLERTVMVTVFSVSDNVSMALATPYSLEVVNTGLDLFWVVLASGDDEIMSFRIDQPPDAFEGHLFAVEPL